MTLIERNSIRPWPTVRSRSPDTWTQGSPGQRPPQGRLVALDREQIVGAAAVQVVGMSALAVQSVRGDHAVAQVSDGVEYRHEGGQLVCADHLDLGKHQPVSVVEDRE
jgi:hypothetical protein